MPPKKGKRWNCKTCRKQKAEKDPGVECSLCNENVGLECTSYDLEVFNYLTSNDIEINYICQECKETLPELRNLLEITKKQKEIEEELGEHDTRITRCEEQLGDLNQIKEDFPGITQRLATLEAKLIDKETVLTIAEKCFKETEFPPIAEVKKNQAVTQKQLEQTIVQQTKHREEAKLREENRKCLIVYGIPETEDNSSDQMREDYITVRDLYHERVKLEKTDLQQVKRLGPKKVNQIRPIRLMFESPNKRFDILRNNRNLVLEDEAFEECESDFCNEADKHHKHIYVSPDKTKIERDEEKELRKELKEKRKTDPDLIIRNGKIIKKTNNFARWSEIQNGF